MSRYVQFFWWKGSIFWLNYKETSTKIEMISFKMYKKQITEVTGGGGLFIPRSNPIMVNGKWKNTTCTCICMNDKREPKGSHSDSEETLLALEYLPSQMSGFLSHAPLWQTMDSCPEKYLYPCIHSRYMAVSEIFPVILVITEKFDILKTSVTSQFTVSETVIAKYGLKRRLHVIIVCDV